MPIEVVATALQKLLGRQIVHGATIFIATVLIAQFTTTGRHDKDVC